MNKVKKGLMLLVVFGVFVASLNYNNNNISAADFAGNEAYWTKKCSQYTTDTSTINTCNEYRQYLTDKKTAKQKESSNLQKELDSMKNNLLGLADLAYEYEQEIEEINAQIIEKESAISLMQQNIKKVQKQIDEQKEKIEERKDTIKERMLDIQQTLNNNQYIDFIMGAESLVDFLQRTESVGTITEYDNKQLELLNKEFELLENDKKELARIKDTMEAERDVLALSKQEAEDKKNDQVSILNEVKNQQQAIKNQKNNVDKSINELSGLMPSVPVPPASSGGGSGSLNWSRNFYGKHYSSPYNPLAVGGYTGQCTWYAWGRATEVNGDHLKGKLPTANAKDWYSIAASRGFSVGSTPRANSIMVWGYGSYGHVAFVESYSNGVITVSEGNVGAPGGGLPMWTSLATAIQYTLTSKMSYSNYTALRGQPIGFIYL